MEEEESVLRHAIILVVTSNPSLRDFLLPFPADKRKRKSVEQWFSTPFKPAGHSKRKFGGTLTVRVKKRPKS